MPGIGVGSLAAATFFFLRREVLRPAFLPARFFLPRLLAFLPAFLRPARFAFFLPAFFLVRRAVFFDLAFFEPAFLRRVFLLVLRLLAFFFFAIRVAPCLRGETPINIETLG